MSGLSSVANFTITEAVRVVVQNGIGLAGMVAFGPKLVSSLGVSGWMAYAVNLLVLSAGTWLGGIVGRAVLG